MFSIPQPHRNDQLIDGLPVVRLSEDAEVLHNLLILLYHISFKIPDSYEKTLALLAVLQKYDMPTVLSTVRSEIGHKLPTTEAAFRAYAIAYSKRLIPEMETSARLTLNHPLTFEAIADALPLFEAPALSDLVRFRKRCCSNLLSFFEGFVDGSDRLSKMWFGCREKRNGTNTLVWLRDSMSRHIERLKETYTNALPEPSSIRKEFIVALITHISDDHCPSCSRVYAKEGEAFRDQLYCRVRKARDEVCILPSSCECGLHIMGRNPSDLMLEQIRPEIHEMPKPDSRHH